MVRILQTFPCRARRRASCGFRQSNLQDSQERGSERICRVLTTGLPEVLHRIRSICRHLGRTAGYDSRGRKVVIAAGLMPQSQRIAGFERAQRVLNAVRTTCLAAKDPLTAGGGLGIRPALLRVCALPVHFSLSFLAALRRWVFDDVGVMIRCCRPVADVWQIAPASTRLSCVSTAAAVARS